MSQLGSTAEMTPSCFDVCSYPASRHFQALVARRLRAERKSRPIDCDADRARQSERCLLITIANFDMSVELCAAVRCKCRCGPPSEHGHVIPGVAFNQLDWLRTTCCARAKSSRCWLMRPSEKRWGDGSHRLCCPSHLHSHNACSCLRVNGLREGNHCALWAGLSSVRYARAPPFCQLRFKHHSFSAWHRH